MILACQNISKSFGTDEIIKNASFHIEENEKAAIVGINGAGKSTLLKIIMQEIDADEGTVTVAKGKTIGYLAQHQEQDSDKTIYEEVLSVKQPVIEMEKRLRAMEDAMNGCDADEMEKLLADYNKLNHEFELQEGYAYKSEVTGVLKGLGFGEEEFDKKIQLAISEVDSGDGVLILCDLLGCTPCNRCAYLLNNRIQVIAGVNLSILLEFLATRDSLKDISELDVEALIFVGTNGLVSLNKLLTL